MFVYLSHIRNMANGQCFMGISYQILYEIKGKLIFNTLSTKNNKYYTAKFYLKYIFISRCIHLQTK